MEPRKEQTITIQQIPWIPAKINPADLVDGPFLLSADDRKKLLSNLEGMPLKNGRISGKDLDLLDLPGKYSVIAHDGQFYLLYGGVKEDKHAGYGTYGVVKYLQNLRTGEFDQVIKIFSAEHIIEIKTRDEDKIRRIAGDELERLTQAKLSASAPAIVRTSKKGFQMSVLMKAMPGSEIFEYTQTHRQLPLQHKLEIAKNLCIAVNNLHQQRGLLHRDIKTENIHLQNASCRIDLVDFGLAIPVEKAGEQKDIAGSDHILAPEIIARQQYSTGSDAFAVGVAIAEVMGFLKPGTGQVVLDKQRRKIFLPSRLDDRAAVTRDYVEMQIYDVCARLMELSRDKRMSLEEAEKEFTAIQQSYFLPAKVMAVNIRDLQKLIRENQSSHQNAASDHEESDDSDEAHQKEPASLSFLTDECDEIIIIRDKDDACSLSEIIEVMREADDSGLIVHDHVLVTERKLSKEEMAAAMDSHFRAYNPILRACRVFDAEEYARQHNFAAYLDGIRELISATQDPVFEKYMEFINKQTMSYVPEEEILQQLITTVKKQLAGSEHGKFTQFAGRDTAQARQVMALIAGSDSKIPYRESPLFQHLQQMRNLESSPGLSHDSE